MTGETQDRDKQLSYRVKTEGSRRRHLAPLALAAVASATGLAVCAAAAASAQPETAYKICVWAAVGTLEAAVLAGVWHFLKRRGDAREDALSLDSRRAGKNRLEAFVELSGTENPLKTAQAAEAEAFYAGTPKSRWPLARLALLALLLFALCGQGVVVGVEHQLKAAREIEKAKQAAKEKAAEKAKSKSPDFASLEFTAPDPESRAKPIDEVLWQATGSSCNGFDAVTLEISVNGERKASLPVEGASLKTKGEIALEGSIELESLNVKPFDLVSYNLKGSSKIGSKADAQILSPPQFIEVRPFREDARLMSAAGGQMEKGMKLLNTLIGFLRSELLLNKALYAARSSGLESGDKDLQEQIAIMAKEQESLRAEVDEFLKTAKPEELTPNIFECLNKCVAHMDDALKMIEQAPGVAKAKGKDAK